MGGWALQQLWLFWIAPLIGAAIAGFTYKTVLGVKKANHPWLISPNRRAPPDNFRVQEFAFAASRIGKKS
jgi:hypothetical protein